MSITEDFSYEILAAVLVIVFLLLLCLEYLWLYLLSKKNEELVSQRAEINTRVHNMLEAMLNSPTESARKAESDSLLEYMGDDFVRKDETAMQIIQLLHRNESLNDAKLEALNIVYTALNPIELYEEKLENGNAYFKGYACRRLADFGATEKIEEIRKYRDSHNKDLAYNAAMALSELGDKESVVAFAKMCEKNHKYSHRVLLEMLQEYTGDREELVREIFDTCNNYVKATTIKAYSNNRISALADLYNAEADSKDSQLKIAAVKAISQLGEPRFEHRLTIALNDKNWIVRLAAVNGLAEIGREGATEALLKAVQDEEWWVRKAAAEAIVKKDKNLIYVEKVLGGNDKYAADAVKNALYKAVNMNGGDLR